MSVLFILAAMYHAIGFLAPAFGLSGARLRHVLFVVIDALCAWYILRRPLWFVAGFTLLTFQQLYSHNARAWVWWHAGKRLDWISFIVIALIPVALALLFKDTCDRRSKRPEPNPAPEPTPTAHLVRSANKS